MVSYSVIVGSSLMTLSQPAMMILRTCGSENWILEEPTLDLVAEAEELEFARVFEGVDRGARKVVGIAQRDIDQPRAWKLVSWIVD